MRILQAASQALALQVIIHGLHQEVANKGQLFSDGLSLVVGGIMTQISGAGNAGGFALFVIYRIHYDRLVFFFNLFYALFRSGQIFGHSTT